MENPKGMFTQFGLRIIIIALILFAAVVAISCDGNESNAELDMPDSTDKDAVTYTATPDNTPEYTLTITPEPTPENGVFYLTDAEIEEMLEANEYSCIEEQILVESAVSLVGDVRYFWGGKCYSVGRDSKWGVPHRVSSPGHETSGTEIPFGLDCSGYVAWCFIQVCKDKNLVLDELGEGTWFQWENSEDIGGIENARLGDFAFVNAYPGNKGNHVGIIVGFDENGQPLIAHCSDTIDIVCVSTCGTDFKYFRRPKIWSHWV